MESGAGHTTEGGAPAKGCAKSRMRWVEARRHPPRARLHHCRRAARSRLVCAGRLPCPPRRARAVATATSVQPRRPSTRHRPPSRCPTARALPRSTMRAAETSALMQDAMRLLRGRCVAGGAGGTSSGSHRGGTHTPLALRWCRGRGAVPWVAYAWEGDELEGRGGGGEMARQVWGKGGGQRRSDRGRGGGGAGEDQRGASPPTRWVGSGREEGRGGLRHTALRLYPFACGCCCSCGCCTSCLRGSHAVAWRTDAQVRTRRGADTTRSRRAVSSALFFPSRRGGRVYTGVEKDGRPGWGWGWRRRGRP